MLKRREGKVVSLGHVMIRASVQLPVLAVLRNNSSKLFTLWPLHGIYNSWKSGNLKVKKGLTSLHLLKRCLHESDSRTAALYNLQSGSWLAWVNDTAMHYAAIHCPR